jgi:hypothetical protein
MDIDIKILPLPTSGQGCCGFDFIISSPIGSDLIMCPVCGDSDEMDSIECLDDNGCEIDLPIYCNKCKIFYSFGCKHAENGCTDGTYFAEFIESFEYNGVKYDGMPSFNSEDDYIQLAKKSQFKFNWICTHPPNIDDVMCLYASYKEPQYYNKCYQRNSLFLNQVRKPIEKQEKQNRNISFEDLIKFNRTWNVLRIMSGLLLGLV